MFQRNHIGHGVGLRIPHYGRALEGPLEVDWFEVITENFLVDGGRPLEILETARSKAPVVLHGVSLCVGSQEPPNLEYLNRVKRLADRIEPAWISDHLCWGRWGKGHYGHDLWPLPMTGEALDRVSENLDRTQEALGRSILLENPSSYLKYKDEEMAEWEFFSELVRRTGCGILLDVNNVYVSAYNQGFDPYEYLQGVPARAVGQIHLAGHQDHGDYLFDAHDHPIAQPVWDLLEAAFARFGPVSTLIERDDDIPAYETLVAESKRAADLEITTTGYSHSSRNFGGRHALVG